MPVRSIHNALLWATLTFLPCISQAATSTCFGTASKVRIENSVQLPASGNNFRPYSEAGVALERTYVHSGVADVVVAAYKALEQSSPGVQFVYGETGWKAGGSFKPHRTHQNGLSVDFFVPVRDKQGKSVPLPTGVTNKFGYDLEFDAKGRFGKNTTTYTIDFNALAEHLYQLDLAAKARKLPIQRVILDPPYLPLLFATPRGEYLKANVSFMKTPAWVRHDEHYHVDFTAACKSI
jgi:penicillin-insensitive murein endopeptidase